MRLILFAALAAVFCAGCGKAESTASRSTVPYSLTSQTVAHLHWLGKKQLATATNAAGLMRIWNQPESARLEAQTLDKLSTAPWRLLSHVATTNFTAAAPLLRSLLDDCVQSESYLEIRAATNQPGELAFAIRLPAARAALWQTNLAAVLESLTGLKCNNSELGTRNSELPTGWSLTKHEPPNHIELTRVGEWVVVGIGQDQNALLGDFQARILKNHTPLVQASADFWLDAALDLRRVTKAFKLGWNLPDGLPEISLVVNGNGQTVHTWGKLDFPAPLELDLEPWQIPVSLIHPPLSSFTAIRGFKPLLASSKVWNDLQIGVPPNQFFGWALNGSQVQTTFFAVPLQNASNRVARVSDMVMKKYGNWFATNGGVNFEKSQATSGLDWLGFPYLTPHLKSMTTTEGEFAYCGLFPRPNSLRPVATEMLNAVLGQSNLVYYDWELTNPRLDQLLYIGQMLRFLSHKAQLPKAACIAWFKVTEPNLDVCLTEAAQTGPNQLSFKRNSSIGFSSAELHFLADWLESPQFPYGFYTLLVSPPPIKGKLRPKTVGSSAP